MIILKKTDNQKRYPSIKGKFSRNKTGTFKKKILRNTKKETRRMKNIQKLLSEIVYIVVQ